MGPGGGTAHNTVGGAIIAIAFGCFIFGLGVASLRGTWLSWNNKLVQELVQVGRRSEKTRREVVIARGVLSICAGGMAIGLGITALIGLA